MKRLYNFKVAFFIVIVIFIVFPSFASNFMIHEYITDFRSNEYAKALKNQVSSIAAEMEGMIDEVCDDQLFAVLLLESTYYNGKDIESLFFKNPYFISWEIISESISSVNVERPQCAYIDQSYLIIETALVDSNDIKRVIRSKYELDILIDYLENSTTETAIGFSIINEEAVTYSSMGVENFDYEPINFNSESINFSQKYDKKILSIIKSVHNFELLYYYDVTAIYGQFSEMAGYFKFLNLIGILVVIYLVNGFSKKIKDPYTKVGDGIEQILKGYEYGLIDKSMDKEYRSAFEYFNRIAQTAIDDNKELKNISKSLRIRNNQIIEMNDKIQEIKVEIEKKYLIEISHGERNNALIEEIEDILWVMNLNGEINYINPIVSEKLGYTPEELVNTNIKKLIELPSLMDQNESITHSFFKEDMRNINLWFISKLEKRREMFAVSTIRIFQDGMPIGVQGIARPIKNELSIQNKIYKKNRELTFLNEINSSLTSNMHLNDLLDNIVSRVSELYESVMVTIQLKEDDYLNLKASHVQPGYETYLMDKSIAIKGSEFESILDSHEIEIMDFVPINKNFDKQNYSDFDFKVVYLPLIYENSVKGVLSILIDYDLTDNDISILNAFLAQGTIVIERSRLFDQLKQNFINTIKVLASAMDAKDSYTQGHSTRVSNLAVLISETLNLSPLIIEKIELAGLLHDIGKIGIRDNILTKSGKLTNAEFDEIMNHPIYAKDILSPIGLEDEIIDAILWHHVRYDLKGYPKEHELERLPLIPAIIGVADAFDAMTSNRSYQEQKSIDESIDELKKYSGEQFDPTVVKAMEEIKAYKLKKLEAIMIN